jgi:hypothetical protein
MFRSWLTTRKWFRYLVASECYNLTHEFVTSKLLTEFNEGGWHTGQNRAILFELDKELKDFTERVKDENA